MRPGIGILAAFRRAISRRSPVVAVGPHVSIIKDGMEPVGYLILNADCRRMPVDLAWVDAVVMDPPYGIGYRHSGRGAPTREKYRGAYRGGRVVRFNEAIAGDDEPFNPLPWLESRKPCLFWGAHHFADRLPHGGSWLAWDKSLGIGPEDDFADCDLAWCSVPRIKRNIFRHLWKGVVCQKKGEDNGRRHHPSLKPIALMRWCIRLMGLPPGSLILDPYMGSGSTLIAALAEGYRAIGVESDPRYCAIARRRIERPHARISRPASTESLPLFDT